jgi:putative ABC transport system substrate-binding protein
MGMRRRDFIKALGGMAAPWPLATAWPLAARAQPLTKVAKVGFLYPGVTSAAPTRIAALKEGIQSVGIAAEQIEVVMRQADGDPTRMPQLAKELLDAKVDVIVAISAPATQAVRSFTTIPVIASDLETDPVGSGLVASFAHPGGNMSGVFFDFPDFATKWIELLKEIVPRLSSVLVMWDPTSGLVQRKAVEEAAAQSHIRLQILEVGSLDLIDDAFLRASKAGADAVLMLSSPVFGTNPQHVADLTLKYRLLAVTLFTEFARAGGLMAYGANLLGVFRQSGTMVGKVLLGAKPADLPIERPSKFELVINLKTAKTLGVVIPTAVLLRADDVIE